jgi:hypothetical protein
MLSTERGRQLERELPRETQLFVNVDQELRTLLTGVQRDPAVVSLCLRPGILQVLLNLKQNLLHCAAGLRRFFDSQRHVFSRFFFLSSADLLQVRCHCSHPLLINESIRTVFPCITALEMELVNQQYLVTAVHTSSGEKLDFDMPWPFSGPAPQVLQEIQERTETIVRAQISGLLDDDRTEGILSPIISGALARERATRPATANTGLEDDAEDEDSGGNEPARDAAHAGVGAANPMTAPGLDRFAASDIAADEMPVIQRDYSMHWVMDKATQAVTVALMVRATSELQALMAPDASFGATLRSRLERLAEARMVQAEELRSLLAGAHTQSDRNKLASVLTVVLYLRDVLRRLIACEEDGRLRLPLSSPVSAEAGRLNWVATSFVQYREQPPGDAGRDCVELVLGERALPYAFALAEPDTMLYVTPLMEEHWYSLLNAAASGLGGAICSNDQHQSLHLARTFAYSLGRPFFSCVGHINVPFKNIANMLRGAAVLDSVFFISDASSLSRTVMAEILAWLKAVANSILVGAPEAVVSHEAGPIYIGTMQPVCLLGVRMKGATSRTPLPADVRERFRVLTLTAPPDIAAVEALLMANGFSEARTLAQRLTEAVHLLEQARASPSNAAGTGDMATLQPSSEIISALSIDRTEPTTLRTIVKIALRLWRHFGPSGSALLTETEIVCRSLATVYTASTHSEFERKALQRTLRAVFNVELSSQNISPTSMESFLSSTNADVVGEDAASESPVVSNGKEAFTSHLKPLEAVLPHVLQRSGVRLSRSVAEQLENTYTLLQSEPVVHLCGASGSGKSTLLLVLERCIRQLGVAIDVRHVLTDSLSEVELVGTGAAVRHGGALDGSAADAATFNLNASGNSVPTTPQGGEGMGEDAGGSALNRASSMLRRTRNAGGSVSYTSQPGSISGPSGGDQAGGDAAQGGALSGGGPGGAPVGGGAGSSGTSSGHLAGGTAGETRARQLGLLPLLLQETSAQHASVSDSEDNSHGSAGSKEAAQTWIVLEGGLAPSVANALLHMSATGSFPLPDGSVVHASDQVR